MIGFVARRRFLLTVFAAHQVKRLGYALSVTPIAYSKMVKFGDRHAIFLGRISSPIVIQVGMRSTVSSTGSDVSGMKTKARRGPESMPTSAFRSGQQM